MNILKEFREFISRGSVIDLAVGVIIGAAFGKLVTALVTNVLMPPIGLVLGKVNFSNLFVALDGKHYESLDLANKAGAAVISYGIFFNACVDFLIQAACIFALVKVINTVYKAEKKAAPPTKTEELLTEIRDSLKKA